MKIALLVDQYFNRTGVGVYTREMVRHLLPSGSGHDYVLVYPGRKGAARLSAERLGAPVAALPDRRWLYPLWNSAGWPPIERLVGHCDLVHVLTGSVRVPCRATLVVTIHDLAFVRLPAAYPWRRRWFKSKMLSDLRQRDVLAIADSEAARRDIIELVGLPDHRVALAYLGVDRRFFQRAGEDEIARVRARYRLPSRFFLFLDVLSRRKNVELLLRGFDQYCSGGPSDVDLVIAGPPITPRFGTVYELWERVSVKHRVHFVGFVADEDLAAVYAAASALVYPSRYEGFGLPVIEAMASGTPVICANATALPEVSGGAALLVSPDDPTELAHAFARIASDDALRQELATKGVERAQCFDWGETARQTLQAYMTAVTHDSVVPNVSDPTSRVEKRMPQGRAAR